MRGDKVEAITYLASLDGQMHNLERSRLLEVHAERTSRSDMDRRLRGLKQSLAKVIIVGCGGIGFHIAKQIALADLAREMYLYDHDAVEATNLNRLDIPSGYLDINKAVMTAAEIARYRPDLAITVRDRSFDVTEVPILLRDMAFLDDLSSIRSGGVSARTHNASSRLGIGMESLRHISSAQDVSRHPTEFMPDELVKNQMPAHGVFVFFDATDNPQFQLALYEAIREQRGLATASTVLYIRASYNGLSHLTITDRTYGWGMDDAVSAYDVVPSWPMPAILAANLAIYYALDRVLAQVERGALSLANFHRSGSWEEVRLGRGATPTPPWLTVREDLVERIPFISPVVAMGDTELILDGRNYEQKERTETNTSEET